jgi:hypothetical protein
MMQEAILRSAPVERAAAPRPVSAWVGRAAAFALGAILLVATFAKAIDPEAFAERLQHGGLTLGLPPLVAAVLALALEAGIGLLLLFQVRRPWTMAATGLLVVTFVAINGWDWWQAAHGVAPASCGCFGNLVQRSPAAAFWQDLLLLVPLFALACLGLPRGASALPRGRLVAAAAAVAAVAVLAWSAPALPLDDVATRIRPGVELANVCAGTAPAICIPDVVPEVSQGRVWVVLVDLKDGARWAEALNRFASRAGNPPVVALTGATRDEVTAFTWQWGPTFSLREAPEPLLRPLYRRLPRSFESDGGRVLRTEPGLPAGEGESIR